MDEEIPWCKERCYSHVSNGKIHEKKVDWRPVGCTVHILTYGTEETSNKKRATCFATLLQTSSIAMLRVLPPPT